MKAGEELIASMGLAPSVVVLSGHGLQPHWIFERPVTMNTAEERDRVKRLLVGLQAILRGKAVAKGWTLDKTADLARVLRIPGTLNRKHERPVPRPAGTHREPVA